MDNGRGMGGAKRKEKVRSSRRQGGGRSELQGLKLKSGRHELVIRAGKASTAQKFWKIDGTHSYVPDKDQGLSVSPLALPPDWPPQFSLNKHDQLSLSSIPIAFTSTQISPSSTSSVFARVIEYSSGSEIFSL